VYRLGLEERALVNQELYNDVVESGNKLSELEVQNSYKLLKDESHLRVIAVRSETAAGRIAAELRQGVPFETLALRHSVHHSARAGGDLGFMTQLYIDEPARSAVLGLKPGQCTEPQRVGNEFHILRLDETRPNQKPPPPLGEFRQELEFRLKQQRRRELAQQFLADLRARLEFRADGLAVFDKPADAITEAEKELAVAVKDGTKYVKVSRLLHIAARFPPELDTAMRHYAVKREVEEDLLYEEARSRGLDKKPAVAKQVQRKREDLLYEALYKQEIADKLAVTDEQVLEYWQANRDKFPDPDPKAAMGMLRNRLQTERRAAAAQAYTARLREGAKITVNQPVLATVRREGPAKPGSN
jgi:parvulin-like peptidyl-prolyl isomerase